MGCFDGPFGAYYVYWLTIAVGIVSAVGSQARGEQREDESSKGARARVRAGEGEISAAIAARRERRAPAGVVGGGRAAWRDNALRLRTGRGKQKAMGYRPCCAG